MIVRILGEGQLEVPADALARINQLDAELEAALTGADEAGFRAALDALLGEVRAVGTPVPQEALLESDIVLPFADATAGEVRELLTEEGLIPG
jgi:hypothetical protein